MPRERKFNFLPLVIERGRSSQEEPYIRLQGNGQLVFNRKCLEYLVQGIKKSFFLKLFCDKSKRAVGFQVIKQVDGGELKGSNIRFVTPQVQKQKGVETVMAKVSIAGFVNSLGDVKIPSGKLFIESYKDNDGYLSIGDVHYVVLPKKEKDEHSSNTQGKSSVEEE